MAFRGVKSIRPDRRITREKDGNICPDPEPSGDGSRLSENLDSDK